MPNPNHHLTATPPPSPAAPRAHALRSLVRLSPLLVLLAPALLAGCGHRCYGCGSNSPAPFQVSYGVVSADFNGDTFNDVAELNTVVPLTATNTSTINMYLSTGPATFSPPTMTIAGTDPLFLVAADINGDGRMDLVTASYDDGAVFVFLNNPASPGSFTAPIRLASRGASQLAVADMNGDGMLDIVSADFGVSLFVQTAPGVFAAPLGLYSSGANWVALGDLNGDGAADVALTDDVGVKVLMHIGARAATTFAPAVSVFTQTPNAKFAGANVVAIADVNGDTLNDLVITDPGPTGDAAPFVAVLLQDPSNHGSFITDATYPIAAQDLPQSIVVKDLTGSGHLDIVIGGEKTVTVLLHDPAHAGKFLPATIYPAPGANEIAVADINGDGKLDIVVSNGVTAPVVNGVTLAHPGVLLGTGGGAFGALQDLP